MIKAKKEKTKSFFSSFSFAQLFLLFFWINISNEILHKKKITCKKSDRDSYSCLSTRKIVLLCNEMKCNVMGHDDDDDDDDIGILWCELCKVQYSLKQTN